MALEQHAIPTEVTTYEFRLVGDMTLKQFAWLAAGIVLGILWYAIPAIPFYFRWPLTLFFPILGAAIAFIPMQGRSLDRWIIAFVRAIYSPTEFIWQKEKLTPAYLRKVKVHKVTQNQTQATTLEQAKLQEYIHSLPIAAASSQQDQKEAQELERINQLLFTNTNQETTNSSTVTTPDQQDLTREILQTPDITTPDTPTDTGQIISMQETNFPTSTPTEQPQNTTLTPDDPSFEELSQQLAQELNIQETTPSPQPNTSSKSDQGQENQITGSTPTMTQPLQDVMSSTQQPDKKPTTDTTLTPSPTQPQDSTSKFQQLLPSNPTQANILVGTVIDAQGNSIDNAILEIKNPHGDPVRALKTNKLGQFAIATPLKNDRYEIVVEKNEYQFPITNINIAGDIIPPHLIQAKP